MSPRNFALIGLRLLGIYFIADSGQLFAAGALMGTFWNQIAPGNHAQATVSFPFWIPGGLQLLEGLGLFFFSTQLARRIVPPVSGESNKTAWSLEEIQALGFAIAGVLIVATSLPEAMRAGQNLRAWYSFQQNGGSLSSPQRLGSWIYSMGVFVQLILGLVLLLTPRGFRNLWHWLRTAGTPAAAAAN